MNRDEKKLLNQRRMVVRRAPDLAEVLRGKFRPWYGKCANPGCKCHKDKRYKHGPYYLVSYKKNGKVHSVYVPLSKLSLAKKWTGNYNEIWEAIEEVSAINIKLLRIK